MPQDSQDQLGRLLFPRAEAARSLSISLGKLEQLIRDGEVSVIRIGRRVLVPRESITLFLNSRHAAEAADQRTP
jgi:excisionase family DNA binding protein